MGHRAPGYLPSDDVALRYKYSLGDPASLVKNWLRFDLLDGAQII
jgi:hypothetical protein